MTQARRAAALIPALWALSLAGCSSVTTLLPLRGGADEARMARYEGTWLMEDRVIHVRRPDSGAVRLAALEWGRGGFRMEQGEMYVTQAGDPDYLSVRLCEKGEWMESYYLLLARFTDGGDLILWAPLQDSFLDALRRGELPGRTAGTGLPGESVLLTGPPDSLLGFLRRRGAEETFDLLSPMILRRLPPSPPGP
ncbi:MAG: hypothetical protein WB626_11095 [Bacteroidota bacterium]